MSIKRIRIRRIKWPMGLKKWPQIFKTCHFHHQKKPNGSKSNDLFWKLWSHMTNFFACEDEDCILFSYRTFEEHYALNNVISKHTFSRNCESGHDVNKTDRDTSDKMAHGAEDLHSRPLASPIANFKKVPLLLFRILNIIKNLTVCQMAFLKIAVKSKCAILSIALFCKRKLKFSGSLILDFLWII